jgi:hypothetical protein
METLYAPTEVKDLTDLFLDHERLEKTPITALMDKLKR